MELSRQKMIKRVPPFKKGIGGPVRSDPNCNWSVSHVKPVDWSCNVDIPFKDILSDSIGEVIPGLDAAIDKIKDPQIDICHNAAQVVNLLGDGVNELIDVGINPALSGLGKAYCDIKQDVKDLEAYVQILADVLNGNLWSLLQLWISRWFPWLNMSTIYYIMIVFLVLSFISVIGGVLSFIRLFV
jgi:hypothetical protein